MDANNDEVQIERGRVVFDQEYQAKWAAFKLKSTKIQPQAQK